jgi:hypothetical protein
MGLTIHHALRSRSKECRRSGNSWGIYLRLFLYYLFVRRAGDCVTDFALGA